MAHGDLEEAIDRLYVVALEAFVPERTALAKRLRADGQRSKAAEVGRLPKPTAAAWALNHVARSASEAIEPWLASAAELRDASAHVAEVGGAALRGAMATHRDATEHLLAVVRERARPGDRPLSAAMLGRVRGLLQAATADAALAERLGAGRLVDDLAPMAGSGVAAEPRGVRVKADGAVDSPPRAGEPADARAAEARAQRRADLEARTRRASQEHARLRDAAAERDAAEGIARERVHEARRALRERESEAGAAERAAERANDAASAAAERLRELRRRLLEG